MDKDLWWWIGGGTAALGAGIGIYLLARRPASSPALLSASASSSPSTTLPTTQPSTTLPASTPRTVSATSVPGYLGSSLGFQLDSPTQTTLVWQPASGATYYRIINVATGQVLGTTTNTSWTLTGLTPGQTYTMRVLPCNPVGCNLNQGPITWQQPTAVSQGTNPLTGQSSPIVVYAAPNGQSVTVATEAQNGQTVTPAPYQVAGLGAVQTVPGTSTQSVQAAQAALNKANEISGLQTSIAQTQQVLQGVIQLANQVTNPQVKAMYEAEIPRLQQQLASYQAQLAQVEAS